MNNHYTCHMKPKIAVAILREFSEWGRGSDKIRLSLSRSYPLSVTCDRLRPANTKRQRQSSVNAGMMLMT